MVTSRSKRPLGRDAPRLLYGHEDTEVPVVGKTAFTITLFEDSELLDELVVVGFGSQRKADVTGAVTQVEMKDVLGDRPIVSASAALQALSRA